MAYAPPWFSATVKAYSSMRHRLGAKPGGVVGYGLSMSCRQPAQLSVGKVRRLASCHVPQRVYGLVDYSQFPGCE